MLMGALFFLVHVILVSVGSLLIVYYTLFHFFQDKFEEELWRASQAKENGVDSEGKSTVDGLIDDMGKKSGSSTIYTPKMESNLSEQVPVFRTQLPKSFKVEERERFMLEVYCGGHPLPTGKYYINPGSPLEHFSYCTRSCDL